MPRRLTIAEVRFPDTPEYLSVLREWRADGSTVMLGAVWSAWDVLRATILSVIDISQAAEDVERSITQLLEPLVREALTGREPFYVQHAPYEEETREPPPAQPPQYDFAFVLRQNPRIMWPVEAKLLPTSRRVARYTAAIRDNFLTCRYAPFSGEGAMLGYLLRGSAEDTIRNVARSLGTRLVKHRAYSKREHRISLHVRHIPPRKAWAREFCCHHMILNLEVPGQ